MTRTALTCERKICWPLPDKACLFGECTFCADGYWVAESRVRRYAETVKTDASWRRAYRAGLTGSRIQRRDH